jgi:hypothetical protein
MRRKIIYLPLLLSFFLSTNMMLSSCKDKKKEETTVNEPTPTATTDTTVQAPVKIEADDPLTRNVADATKDYPTVKTSVRDGIVTLTGEVKRTDLKKLMMAINELHPKKIDNQLVIK